MIINIFIVILVVILISIIFGSYNGSIDNFTSSVAIISIFMLLLFSLIMYFANKYVGQKKQNKTKESIQTMNPFWFYINIFVYTAMILVFIMLDISICVYCFKDMLRHFTLNKYIADHLFLFLICVFFSRLIFVIYKKMREQIKLWKD